MRSEKHWIRKMFTREMPLEEDSPLTASFEIYDVGVIGIHLTGCFENGLPRKEALDIIDRFGSRTEYDEIGSGVYILVRGELPYFEGYSGLQIETYYLTGRTIVYKEIIENQDALDWFLKQYSFFLRDLQQNYNSELYYRDVSFDGKTLTITTPNVKRGSRHKTLLSYGGRLLSEGYPMERVETKMYDFNMLYCVPPLPFEEFLIILKSVKKYNREV